MLKSFGDAYKIPTFLSQYLNNMITEVTNGIKVSVTTEYLDSQSRPEMRFFLFAYKIKIENISEHAVQLLRRHWNIFDSHGEYKEVEGEGVVGKQPTILPGESYEYESGCNLDSEIGSMHGTYLMQRKIDGKKFNITIPRFELVVPSRLN